MVMSSSISYIFLTYSRRVLWFNINCDNTESWTTYKKSIQLLQLNLMLRKICEEVIKLEQSEGPTILISGRKACVFEVFHSFIQNIQKTFSDGRRQSKCQLQRIVSLDYHSKQIPLGVEERIKVIKVIWMDHLKWLLTPSVSERVSMSCSSIRQFTQFLHDGGGM